MPTCIYTPNNNLKFKKFESRIRRYEVKKPILF